MLLTVQDVAVALRVTPDTVRHYIRAGTLEAIRLPGGSFRIPAEQIAALAGSPRALGRQGEQQLMSETAG